MHTSVQMNKRSHNFIKAVTMPNSDYKTPIILQHHNTVQFLTCVFNINIIKCHSMNLFKNSNNNILIRLFSSRSIPSYALLKISAEPEPRAIATSQPMPIKRLAAMGIPYPSYVSLENILPIFLICSSLYLFHQFKLPFKILYSFGV